MSAEYGIGKIGMAGVAVAAAAMFILSYFFNPDLPVGGVPGICLPSPSYWIQDPFLSWIVCTATTAAITAGLYFLNHSFNFIKSTQPVLPAVFLLLTASNPWITNELNASIIICAVNIIALSTLFHTYNSENATQEMFLIATFLSVGSMFEYAFIPLIAAYLVGAVAMKVMRFKELMAFAMGLLAPYWVGIGLGIIPLDWFRLPEMSYIFGGQIIAIELYLLLVSVAVAIFIGVVVGITVSIKLYAGNSKVNAMNFCISAIGIVCLICIFIDFSNMPAYLATLYFTVAVQLANLCALWRFRHEWMVTAITGIIFIGFFIAMISI